MKRVGPALAAALLAATATLPAAAVAPLPVAQSTNTTATLDSAGVLHVQVDVDGAHRTAALVLPARARVDGDPDVWQVLTYERLATRTVSGPVGFTADRTDDTITVRPENAGGSKRVTYSFDVRGAASDTRLVWPAPVWNGVALIATTTIEGPGTAHDTSCTRVDGDPCRATNNSGRSVQLTAEKLGPRGLRVDVGYEPGALSGDTRRLDERLTPRTWIRHWWPAVAAGALALVAGTTVLARRRHRAG